ncbi:maltose O-acetyltransferase [Xylanibacter ruminicola]|uniref:Maltose O-acetyltransferase n=1 Tax=Xylanibacter ruminicola TaxID=839 RepID=A0A1H4C452_XYLRU|nr:acyltransferase [Xylanibacter ruminicola]SEA55156.1 maltose O-acetyltransferase [Xylanibacter ruminicola]
MATFYENYVWSKSHFSYYRGLISRYIKHIKYRHIIDIARKNGAEVGDFVTMPKSLAKKLNSNCKIGSHVSINTDKLDTRAPLIIGSYVIIGSGTEVITVSHNINSTEWEPKYYGVEIEDYVWVANNALVLPSCRKIGMGAVIAAGSVVVKNVDSLSVVSGNPAIEFKRRKTVHKDLIVERLLHGDYDAYKKTFKSRKHD